MKVQLVFAPTIIKTHFAELSEGRLPPLGLLYLAAYARREFPSVEFKVTDGLLTGLERTIAEVKSFKPDVLGVSLFTPCALGGYELINRVKAENPGIFIVVGGPHATALPEEVLAKSAADVVVIGEGELTFAELLGLCLEDKRSTRSLEEINGLVVRRGNGLKRTAPRRAIEDLDSLPYPARDLINLNDYKGWYLNRETMEGAVLFSRGCAYNCTFCANVVWRSHTPKVRHRSAKNIVDEIEYLHRTYGVSEIYDCSDEFNNSVKHALAICDEIIKRGLKVSWKTSMRVAPLPEELVRKMAESGCWYVLVGIETGNQETLQGIKKKITFDQVETACRLFRKYDIRVNGLFMLYNVWEENKKLRFESTEMVHNTFRYMTKLVKSNLLDYVGWSITMPYPGSELYCIATRYNLIKPEYEGKWDYWLVGDSYVMNLPGINWKDQVRMKTLGQILRGRLILKNKEFGFKDLGLMFKKALKLLLNEFKAAIGINPLRSSLKEELRRPKAEDLGGQDRKCA